MKKQRVVENVSQSRSCKGVGRDKQKKGKNEPVTYQTCPFIYVVVSLPFLPLQTVFKQKTTY